MGDVENWYFEDLAYWSAVAVAALAVAVPLAMATVGHAVYHARLYSAMVGQLVYS
eukprot:gene2836-13611_t